MNNISSNFLSMWENEKFLEEYFKFMESLYWYPIYSINILWLWDKWIKCLDLIKNPNITKFEGINTDLLKYKDYWILFVLFSWSNKESYNLLKNNIDSINLSNDLVIWINLDWINSNSKNMLFKTYTNSDIYNINYVIDWILSLFVLPWLICFDVADIINFFKKVWKFNCNVVTWNLNEWIENIVNELNNKDNKNCKNKFLNIFASTGISMYNIDDIARWIEPNNEDVDFIFGCPITENIIKPDEVCCILITD